MKYLTIWQYKNMTIFLIKNNKEKDHLGPTIVIPKMAHMLNVICALYILYFSLNKRGKRAPEQRHVLIKEHFFFQMKQILIFFPILLSYQRKVSCKNIKNWSIKISLLVEKYLYGPEHYVTVLPVIHVSVFCMELCISDRFHIKYTYIID